jgi:superfamily II DNA or RNA helicase
MAYIKKTKLDKTVLHEIKKDLTAITTFQTEYADGDNAKYSIYREKKSKLLVPRNYYYKNIVKLDDETNQNQDASSTSTDKMTNKMVKIKHKFDDGIPASFEFTKQLRDQQLQIANECINKLQNSKNKNNCGIITLPCGFGKTVIGLYIAAQLKIKTLIIVHKTFLQDQWFDRIKEFTNASIGIIRQQKTDTKDKDIVVGMLQSISMIKYDKSLFKDFGLVIYDEAHHVISNVFSNALYKIKSKYCIGLTATPNTGGNLSKVLHWHLGNVIYKIDTPAKNNDVVVKTINYSNSNDKLFVEKKLWFKGMFKPNVQKMINNICMMASRNQLIADLIYNLWINHDRKILVLSGRNSKVEHLRFIKEMIEDKIKQNDLLQNECNIYYYTGKTSQLERSEAEKHADILLATYEMAHEGLDIPRLNTIVLTTPKTSVKQAIGRIMRQIHANNQPLIVDFVDELSVFPKQYDKRLKLYQNHNYVVKDVYVKNDKIISKKDYLMAKYKCSLDDLKDESDYEPSIAGIIS